ncbi:MAG TPA: zinc-ribbon domain-containing protein, partial [Chloroflexia bacterium]|nr:zinc-ribbon domain-containing protein [Chloroflexia bacterium]
MATIPYFCPRCGAANTRDAQYCDQCSFPLRGAAPPPPGAPGPAAGADRATQP